VFSCCACFYWEGLSWQPRWRYSLPALSASPLRPEHTQQPLTLPVGGATRGKGQGVVGAFYVDWDEVSLASLRLHASELTHLFPSWLHLHDTGDGLQITDHDPSDDEARALARQHHLAIFPLVNNFSANINDFEESRLHKLLSDPKKRSKVAKALLSYVREHHDAGINLDLETESDEDRERLALFAQEVGALFHVNGFQVSACTQVGEPEQAATIARPCDFVFPMIYDLHYASGTVGAIAPETWAEHELSGFLKAVPADKTVLAIGNYTYDWVVGKAGVKTLVPTLAPAADLGVLFAALSGNLYLLFAVLVRTLRAALSGVRAGWGKLERRGSAQIKLSKK
jgi:spore germination protein YaaH